MESRRDALAVVIVRGAPKIEAQHDRQGAPLAAASRTPNHSRGHTCTATRSRGGVCLV
jgi:hypothetical protein